MGQQQIDSFQAGGNRQGLNFQQVRSFALPTPGIDEQQFVAKALGCADESKEETQQYLNQLRIHKAALMQQLFPSAEESFDADNR
jgi:type I restriction enzyme S subunit